MDDEYLMSIGNDDLIFTSGAGLETFIGKYRLEDKVVALFL